MEIRFSGHARARLKDREISKTLIVKAIQKPDEIISSFRGRRLFRKRVGDKILEVVAVKEKRFYEVVTAYYLEEKNEN